MHDGYQVVRFDNKIKPKDIGGLGVELDERKGSGNYDASRTKFNVEYISFNKYTNLSSKVYSTLYKEQIHFNKSENTNILNGCIITSGPEFFQSLGLPMKDTGRVYAKGEKKGQPVYCPDINSNDDVPEKVYEYFKESYEFISNIVGKENVMYAGVHLDEDTPHMHIYWLPVVNQVKRKVFETDENGKRITREITDKKGITKSVPIQKRDEKGKLVYKIEEGKFLDSDQFWKQLGGKASYAKIQDEYNNFIISKGFNLNRGKIGSNKHHIDKAKYNLLTLQEECKNLSKEIKYTKEINDIELKTNKELLNLNEEDVLSPNKDILKRYKEEDINRLINYTKEVKKDNISSKKEIETQNIKIRQLTNEINGLKSGSTIKEKDRIIKAQEKVIEEQKGIISSLKEEVDALKQKVKDIANAFFYKLNEAYLAVGHLLGLKNLNKYDLDHDKMEKQVYLVNNDHKKHKDRDMEL